MAAFGMVLQVAGLLLTGYAVVSGFWIEVSEGALFAFGFGGFAVFYVGTLLRRRGG